ncbi:alpha/beta fold hydrolase [Gordonia phthalatica]|uniref:alpha/beta fold hydrolase n=1 Tax=Gordonia phthalatica TaxID=1136941 RepID=UPI000AA4217D|nr:hypothetical protein [Gordonia phthalatica]
MAVPALVLAGDEDPIVKTKAGEATARRIPGARFEMLRGAGHDIPEPLWDRVADAVRGNADRAGKP